MNTPTHPLHIDVTWDPVKAHTNLEKHKVTFTDAAQVLLDPLTLSVYDVVHSDFEERWFSLGRTANARLLAVSHTYQHTGPIDVKVRIISAREATRRERLQYENEPR